MCWKIKNIGDRSGQIRHQHLKLVTNIDLIRQVLSDL